MLPIVLLTLVCMFTYSFEIVFGLAGTIMMIPLMATLYDAKTLVVYSTLPQILVAAIGLTRSPKTVKIGFLATMLGFAAAGSAAGLALFYYFSTSAFQLLLATVMLAFGLALVMTPERLTLGPSVCRALDILAGISQALFGISGPVAMTRLMATFNDKTIVRNYALAFFLALNIIRALGYIANKTYTPDIVQMIVISAPFLAITFWFSNHLHFKVNERLFRRVVAWIIVVGAASLFFHYVRQ